MNPFVILIGLLCLPFWSNAQIENERFKPYYFFYYSRDIPETHIYGAFHYTSINNTVKDDEFGSFYQSGMMHTWYKPAKIYDLKDYSRELYGYHTIEGGIGYKRSSRFFNPLTPHKFLMGGVAGGFASFSNGPGNGVPGFNRSIYSATLRWEENKGRYGAAVLTNKLLFPLDGIGLEGRAHNKLFGYGYYALPLTEPKSTTEGTDKPTGNRCWTLFFNTENFTGPVTFHTPHHWSKRALTQESTTGRNFDNSLLHRSPVFQRETNHLPAKKWTDSNGDIYYKCSPVFVPVDEDGIGRLGTMPMNMDSTMWDAVSEWFDGGAVASQNFDQGDAIHLRTNTGATPSFTFDNTIAITESSFAQRISDPQDPSAVAFKWQGDLIQNVEGRNMVQLPEYYVLTNGSNSAEAIPESEVPDESGLKEINSRADYEADWDYDGFNNDPIFTPMHPDFDYSDPVVDVWKNPGPKSGPYYTQFDDGSTAVYYWYKFNEQPSILNSDMDDAQRALIQERVERIHENWNYVDSYIPDPNKEKVTLDRGLLVSPPPGLEVGYVPICVHQQLSSEPMPEFPEINLYTPPLKVYILAGQSNTIGHGQIANAQLPGTLAYTLANDISGTYDFLDDGNGGYVAQDDVRIYFEHQGNLLTGDLAPGFGTSETRMGLEVTFGERMQQYTKQPILLIKAAWGGKSLAVNFRPPSSGGETGFHYNEILRVVNDALSNISDHYPDYNADAGYEIAGLAWHQGWNDHVNAEYTAEYTENLANLIRDLRSDLGANFPVAIATTAMPIRDDAFGDNSVYKDIELAQLAIADTKTYPEFEGNVAVIDAKKYWISPTLSPVSGGGQHYHWNQNAKTYMDIGFGMADALHALGNSSNCTNHCEYTPIPALLQAEDYTTHSGTQTEPCSDVDEGENVGYIDLGDYLTYRIKVPSTGNYEMAFRVASPSNPTQFDIYQGSEKIGSIDQEATGAWQEWTTTTTRVTLSQGNQTLKLVATGGAWNINWLDLTFAGGNVALNGKATQSSDSDNTLGIAALAIDGNTNGAWDQNSVTQTLSEETPWWQVRWDQELSIGAITIWNRTDECCKDNLSNFDVFVYDSEGVLNYKETITAMTGPSITINAQGAIGSRVRVKLKGTDFLSLAEVQIYEHNPTLSVHNLDNSQSEIVIYPNPFKESFRIVVPQYDGNSELQLQLINIAGQIVKDQKYQQGSIELKLDKLVPKGLYILKATYSNGRQQSTQKIIKM